MEELKEISDMISQVNDLSHKVVEKIKSYKGEHADLATFLSKNGIYTICLIDGNVKNYVGILMPELSKAFSTILRDSCGSTNLAICIQEAIKMLMDHEQ